jgi:hypothetical protein
MTVGRTRPICRKNCVASDRACTRVTLRNLHGKEGVDGSSPSEGLHKCPANATFLCCLRWRDLDASRVRDGYILTGGHSRARATSRDTAWNVLETLDRDRSLEKFLQLDLAVARPGAKLATSFTREGVDRFESARGLVEKPRKKRGFCRLSQQLTQRRVREAPRSAATRTRCRTSRSRGSPCRKRGRRPRAESRLAP